MKTLKEDQKMSDTEKEGTELTLEENFERLEELAERLEEDDISLEDAFAAYSEGMKLLKTCNDQIDRVEKQVLKLTADAELEEL